MNTHTIAILLSYVLVIYSIGTVYTSQTVYAHYFSKDDAALFFTLIYK